MKKLLKEKTLSRAARKKLDQLKLTALQYTTAEKLLLTPADFMPDRQFRHPSKMAPIMAQDIRVAPGQTLDSHQEPTLFLQMNYSRYKLSCLSKRLLRQGTWQQEDILELLQWNRQQLELRSRIVTANMGLVLAMAKHVTYSGVEFSELISEGSMALLRATEKFDCSRGWKFSTYACRAIFKGFSRAAKQNYRYRNHFPTQWDPALETQEVQAGRREENQAERVDELLAILRDNDAELSGTELSVVKMRFSLGDGDSPLTLKEVGRRLGLTKERIRQIQNKALEKIREVAENRIVMG